MESCMASEGTDAEFTVLSIKWTSSRVAQCRVLTAINLYLMCCAGLLFSSTDLLRRSNFMDLEVNRGV